MSNPCQRFSPAATVAGAVLAACAVVLFASPASADQPLPFTDKNADGFIGLCDRSGHQVTSGKITDIPFVWRAVSSTPAPANYFQKGGGRAFLAVYQPREGLQPGEWTGKMFTNSSAYSNPAHPMAQGTNADPPLLNLTSIAPLWDGLLELRLIYTAENLPVRGKPYPATVIKVSGDTWTVVSGSGSVSCVDGGSTSDTTAIIPSAIPSQSPTLGGGAEAALRPPVGSAPDQQSSSPSPGASDSAADPSTTSVEAVAAGSNSPVSFGVSPWLVLALIVLPMAGIAGGFAFARRSPARGTHRTP